VITSVVMGVFAGISWITGFTMIGHEVADRLRGRVFAFVMSSVRIMLLGTIAAGPILANSIGFHALELGTYRMVFTGPGIVLAASGLLTIGVAIFAGRQVGGLRGHFLRKLGRRLLRGRRRDLIDIDETLPGVFVAVVGADPAAVQQYADRVLAHLEGDGWIVQSVRHDVGDSRQDDAEPDALRTLAELSDIVARRIRPALEAGETVVCADYRDPIIVRFGVHAGLGPERLLRMAQWSSGGLVPDVFLLVDGTGDESDAYRDLAAAAPDRYLKVPAPVDDDLLPEDVLDQLASVSRQHSPRRAGDPAEHEDGVTPVTEAGGATGPGNATPPEDGVIPAGDDDGVTEDSAIPDGIR
jgi:dTMP kinase